MTKVLHYLIATGNGGGSRKLDWVLLALRIIVGGLMLVHGIQKAVNYEALSATFPDPICLGGGLSLGLAVFAELACSLGVIFGVLYRLALIPMIFTMCVAAFVVMRHAPWSSQELPVMYLALLVLMFAAGAGRLSVDALVGRWLSKR